MNLCELRISGTFADEKIGSLGEILGEQLGLSVSGALELQENRSIMIAVKDQEIPDDLHKWLSENNLSYVWQIPATPKSGAIASYFDHEANRIHSIRVHEELFVIPLDQADLPDAIAELKDIRRQMRSKGLWH